MKEPQKKNRGILIYILFVVILVGAAFFISRAFSSEKVVAYPQYEEYLADKKIVVASIHQNEEVPTGYVSFALKDQSETYRVYVTDVTREQENLLTAKIPFEIKDVPGEDIFLTTILPTLILGILIFVLFGFMTSRINNANGSGMMSNFITKNRATMSDPKQNRIRFKDVAGLDEEKEEVAELVDFLQNPKKYTDMGARVPKGVILVGVPGTGKTLLAKALAGEAGVPFFSISGSDFVEMFVGVGASRVRELFAEAKRNSPCIVFIDEIDAVARIRGSGLGGGHDEREQTLNQLLVEMDGFEVNQGIIVIAATNRVDILDPAILRPGRFDRRVAIGKPDVKGREAILKVHAKNKPIHSEVDFHSIALVTAGFTGADLENLLNEAAISVAKANGDLISSEDINAALVKVGIGQEKKSHLITERDKKITAYHEMGHAILFKELPDVGPVHTISIIPTGLSAAGYTMPQPEQDEMFETKSKMLQEIMVSMGGRIAEEITFSDITTGASADIKHATDIARSMVTKYGMSDKLGFANYEGGEDSVFMGRDLGHTKNFGMNLLNDIEEEVQQILSDCYRKAKEILLSQRDILEKGAALLMEKEKINREEFEALYE